MDVKVSCSVMLMVLRFFGIMLIMVLIILSREFISFFFVVVCIIVIYCEFWNNFGYIFKSVVMFRLRGKYITCTCEYSCVYNVVCVEMFFC